MLTVESPNVRVRAFELLLEKVPMDASWLLKLSVPLVNVTVPDELNALVSCQVPPTPLKLIVLLNVALLVLMFFVPDVAEKLTVPLANVGFDPLMVM